MIGSSKSRSGRGPADFSYDYDACSGKRVPDNVFHLLLKWVVGIASLPSSRQAHSFLLEENGLKVHLVNVRRGR